MFQVAVGNFDFNTNKARICLGNHFKPASSLNGNDQFFKMYRIFPKRMSFKDIVHRSCIINTPLFLVQF